METFTIVTGIASLIGFGIQMFDIFPQLGKRRKELALVFLGVFLGSLIRAIEPASIRLKLEISWTVVLVGLFVVTFFSFIWMAAIDRQDRQVKYIFLFTIFCRCLHCLLDGSCCLQAMTPVGQSNLCPSISFEYWPMTLNHAWTMAKRPISSDSLMKGCQQKIQGAVQ